LLVGLAFCWQASLPATFAAEPSPGGQPLIERRDDGSVRKIVNAERHVLPGDPAHAASVFLASQALLLFGAPATWEEDQLVIGDLTLRDMRTSSSLSGTHVWKQAFVAGIPIHEGHVVTHLSHDNRVLFATSGLTIPRCQPVAHQPAYPAGTAIAAAAALLGGDGQRRLPPSAELVILPGQGADRLAWRVLLAAYEPYGDWEIFLDAQTGEEIGRQNRLICIPPHRIPPRIPVPVTAAAGKNPAAGVVRATGSGLVFLANPLNGHADRYGWRDGDTILDTVRDAVVLTNLDGSGYLVGPWVEVFNSDAPRAFEPSLVFEYSSLVTDGPFQEVNVYHHINEFQEYLQGDLGITCAHDYVVPCYAHAGEDDNSDFSPWEDRIRFGDGGVDDSEDGEIVVHEYGHAIHFGIVGLFNLTGETGALSEGFGDYLAATFGDNALVGEWDATVYNPGPPPFLRRTDGDKHYPEDIQGQVHADGEIISAAWWDIRLQLGALLTDQLVVEGMFYTGPSATFRDHADGVAAADLALYGGAHLDAINQAFDDRGIGLSHLLVIHHTELGGYEGPVQPLPVTCTISHTAPITAPDAVKLHYWYFGLHGFQEEAMTPTGNPDEWTGNIACPATDRTVAYYLSVQDDLAETAILPAGAPSVTFNFSVVGTSDDPCQDGPADTNSPPQTFALRPNFPNPFNPETWIRFDLPVRSRVCLRVFDVAGRPVRTLLEADLPAASHEIRWDGRDDTGRPVASGSYFYRLATEQRTATGKMILAK